MKTLNKVLLVVLALWPQLELCAATIVDEPRKNELDLHPLPTPKDNSDKVVIPWNSENDVKNWVIKTCAKGGIKGTITVLYSWTMIFDLSTGVAHLATLIKTMDGKTRSYQIVFCSYNFQDSTSSFNTNLVIPNDIWGAK